MYKRKVWVWIVGAAVLLIIGLTVGGLGMLGRLPWQFPKARTPGT